LHHITIKCHADTGADIYDFTHDSENEVNDSGCKVKALQFLNNPSHELIS